MKKRLLSAALALAMVLTLLPVSAFAALPSDSDLNTEGKQSVNYVTRVDDEKYKEGEGWYVTVPYKGADGKSLTKYVKVDEGYSVNGKFYADIDDAANASTNDVSGTIIVIGNTSKDIMVHKATSLKLEMYAGSITVKAAHDKFTSLTVTRNRNQYASGTCTVALDTSLDDLTSLTLNDVTLDSNIAMESTGTNGVPLAHSVKLTNVTVGNHTIELVGAENLASKVAGKSQNVEISGGTATGKITVVGAGSKVSLSGVSGKPPIDITGTGSLNIIGGSQAGAVTVVGNQTDKANSSPASVTVSSGSSAESITLDSDNEEYTGTQSISVSGTVGAINVGAANVTVSGGNTANITLGKTGNVTVSGTRSTVGDVKFEGTSSTFELSNSSTYCKVGKIEADASALATCTIKVPKSQTNTLGTKDLSVSEGYAKKTIQGGTWLAEVPKAALATGLVYQLAEGAANTEYTYYTDDEFGDVIVRQGNDKNNTLTVAGQDPTGADTITFQNGEYVWGVLTAQPKTLLNKLPSKMNTVATPQWTDGVNNPKGGDPYNTPSTKTAKGVVLDAMGGGAATGSVTKLVDAAVSGDSSISNDVTAKVVNNVITLTGAVPPGQTSFTLKLETDAVVKDATAGGNQGSTGTDTPVVIEVGVTYNPDAKMLVFDNIMDTDLGSKYGVTVNGLTSIKLRNGTVYTLNGSGLTVRSSNIKVVGVDSDGTYPGNDTKTTNYSFIEVTVSASGYTSTPQLKQQVIDVIKKTEAGASFDWSNSPAMRQAINAALATITDAQVSNWIESTQKRAWNERRSDKWTNTSPSLTDYTDDVWLVPYLQVNVTDYKPSTAGAQNGSMTLTMTPMWRVEVWPDGYKKGESMSTGATSGTYWVRDKDGECKDGVLVVKKGTALTGISGSLKGTAAADVGVEITFSTGISGAAYAHQNGTYDYDVAAGAFTVTHGGTSGLGTFVIDNVKPLITVFKSKNDTADPKDVLGRYSNLQAAADDAANEEYIEIDSNYTGSTTFNMTGLARTIYVQSNGKNVVVGNATGGVAESNNQGNLYTIRLNRDMSGTPVEETPDTTVSVIKATGGSARVSNSKAKAGEKVTITLTPSTGYTSNGVTVRTAEGTTVTATGSGNSYSFTMPSNTKKVTVTPAFKKTDTTGATVTVSNTSNGGATTSAGTNKVNPGTRVTVKTTPRTGYRTMGLYVTANSGTATATRTGDDTFTFTVPSNATNVVVTPRFDVNNGTKFEDVWSTEYYSTPVAWAVNRGVTDGTSTYTFSPNNSCTRADMVTFLYRAAGSPAVGNVANPFWDVQPGAYYYNAVLWAVSKGITKGVEWNRFGVNEYVTRGQAVTFLYRYNNSPAASNYSGFYDVSGSEYYAQAVAWARASGVTDGTSATLFSPYQYVTRAQAVTFLYRNSTGVRA